MVLNRKYDSLYNYFFYPYPSYKANYVNIRCYIFSASIALLDVVVLHMKKVISLISFTKHVFTDNDR
ncbi:hypothetical protein RIF29_04353 [Crotalaria pallida]|uniref:Uncharacterized protein n=1 Tax=Crotalaria pallida TaxID=3830 RepID=A0AAN9J0X5_CROPI